jgi:hypothetical protein
VTEIPPADCGHEAERPEDAARWQVAKQLRADYPAWVIIWVARKGEYWAYPLFRTRREIAVNAAEPADLVTQLDEIQRAARAPRAVPGGTSSASGAGGEAG